MKTLWYIIFVKLTWQKIRKGGIFALKNRIEEIRKEKGIKQEDFAKLMGVSRQTISSLETGKYNPSIFLAYKIAKYFEMTIEEVFIFDEEMWKEEDYEIWKKILS